MAIRNVYSRAEDQIIADFKKAGSEQEGWVDKVRGQPVTRNATLEAIDRWGKAADYWNPLWRDENYAKNTRWGGIIAFPLFEYYLMFGGPQAHLKVPPEVGILRQTAYGDSWECYTPVRPGDTFKYWCGTQQIEDITALDGKSPRQFRVSDTLKYINQNDQVTSVYHRRNSYILIPPEMTDKDFIFPAGNPEYHGDLKLTKDSKYTKEEITAIDSVAGAEKIRGSEPRYWENVNTGDKLTPIVQGPVTLWDAILNIQSFGFVKAPMREMLRRHSGAAVIDPETNIPHHSLMWRLDAGVAKLMKRYSTTLYEPFINQILCRIVTNWMGDDGFILRFYHRKASNTPMGDTIVGTGKVIKKYRGENGAYLVDLAVEMETNRGNLTNMALATVSLPSKE